MGIAVQHAEVHANVAQRLLEALLAHLLADHDHGAVQELADGEELIERRERVLKDRLHVPPVLGSGAALEIRDVLTVKDQLAGGDRHQAENHSGDRRLT